MLTLYQVKPAFQNWLRPGVNQLARWGITPNQVTVTAIALSVTAGLAIAQWPTSSLPLLALPGVLLGRMALNAIDGMLAREHNLITPLGAVLNELGDVVSDAVLYLPFAAIPEVASSGVVAVVILALLTEFVGVLGLAITGHRPYDGPMGKSDRALAFATLAIALGLGLPPGPWLAGGWLVISLLSLWTIVNRMRAILQEVAS